MKIPSKNKSEIKWLGLPARCLGALIIGIPVSCLMASIFAIASMRDIALQTSEQAKRASAIIKETNYLYKTVLAAENGIDSYVKTGRKEFIEPYILAKKQLPKQLKFIEEEINYNPSNVALFEQIESSAKESISSFNQTLAIINKQKSPNSQTLQKQLLAGKQKITVLGSATASLVKEKEKEQQKLNNEINFWINWTNIAQYVALVSGCIGGAASLYLFSRLQEQVELRENYLKESKIRIQAVVDNAGDAIITLDEQGVIEFFNLAAEAIFGYSAKEIQGLNLRLLLQALPISENTTDSLSLFLNSQSLTLIPCRQQIKGKRKNGSLFEADINISEIELENRRLFIAICRDITEQIAADATLRNQAQLLDLATDSILVWNFDDEVLTYWNQGSHRLYGWRKKTALGNNVHGLLKTEFPESIEVIKQQLLQEGYWEGNLIQETQGGIKVTVASRWTLQRDEQGNPLAVLQIDNDITEKQAAENALRNSETMLQLVINNIPQYISWKDCQSVYLGCNNNVAKLFDLAEPAEIVGKTDFDFPVRQAKAQLYRQLDQKVMDTNTAIYHQIEQLTITDSPHNAIWVDSNKVPLTNASGEVVGILCSFEDITERRMASQALAESEQLFRVTFEQAAVGMAQVTLAGNLLRVNQKFCEIVAREAEELQTITFQEITHAEDLSRDLAGVNQLLAGEVNSYTVEKRYLRPDNEPVWVNLMVSLMRDAHGQQFFFAVVEDITERKQAQQDLMTRAQELATMAAILAKTTSNLKKRNQELDQFAYVVSHDLKAPLRAIANLSSWIEEDLAEVMTEETCRQMNLLRGRVHRMEALINGLLEYSRVGRIKTGLETVNVEQLLMDVIDSLAPTPSFQVQIALPMPVLTTQRLPLEQVFSNLISNAIKHNSNQAGSVQIAVTEKGDFYEFTVTDDGPGIAAQYHEKVFVIFSTLEPRDKVENTGIGLSLVKKIVENQGGTIKLESQVGQGATFRFTWPKQSTTYS